MPENIATTATEAVTDKTAHAMGGKVKTTKTKKTAAPKPRVKLDRSMKSDVPAKDRRLALLKLLRKHGATKVSTAKPISFLAAKLGYTPYDVYMLTYRTSPLVIQELVKTCQTEEHRDLSVYLTAKGVKSDPK